MTRETKERSAWSALLSPTSLIVICAAGLTVLGVIILFSASASFRSDPYFFVKRQLVWMVVAVVAGCFASAINLERMRPVGWYAAGALLIALVLVLIPSIGVSVNGSRRWLELGPMRLQPSEMAKLVLVFTLAHYLAANQKLIPTFWRGFILPCVWISIFALLIMAEPDFGTAMLTGMIGFAMLFLAGARLLYLAPTVALGAVAFGVAIWHNPVRLARITAFLDIEANRSDGAYQLYQAILAFGAGGVQGVGLGSGRQQMAFLPEAHTDFIFAIVGEELGLIFTLLVVALFTVIFIAGIIHLRRAPNLFHFLLVAGCLFMITGQALINLGVVTGLLPTKGMSLPFISYGGSNLVVMGLIIGILVNTNRAWSRPALRGRQRGLEELRA
jgi:cell division protein FtsW